VPREQRRDRVVRVLEQVTGDQEVVRVAGEPVESCGVADDRRPDDAIGRHVGVCAHSFAWSNLST